MYMATRVQQVLILQGMADKIQSALRIARQFNKAQVPLDPDNPQDTTITLTAEQKQAFAAAFDGYVAGVKSDAGTL
jgi:hypothetical protein